MPFRCYKDEQIRDTASVRDGVDFDTESKYRREGALFIIETGRQAGFSSKSIVAAVVYFQRFYVFRSFVKFSKYVTACSCLLIAGKSEKTTHDLNDTINVAKDILTTEKIENHGLDSEVKVKEFEQTVLETLKTDLEVVDPYKFIVQYTKHFKGDKRKCRRIAWNFAAESLSTTLPLKFKPEMIAKASLLIAVKICGSTVLTFREPNVLKWCDDLVGDNKQILEEIGNQILYAQVAHKEYPIRPTELEESGVTPNPDVTPHSAVTECSSKKNNNSVFAIVSSTLLYISDTFRKASLIYHCIKIAIKHFDLAFKMWQRSKGQQRRLEGLYYVSKHLVTAINNSLNATNYMNLSIKDINSASKWIASVLFDMFRTLSIC